MTPKGLKDPEAGRKAAAEDAGTEREPVPEGHPDAQSLEVIPQWGRDLVALRVTYDKTDERHSKADDQIEKVGLERAGRQLGDRITYLEEAITGHEAISLKGAMVQVMIASGVAARMGDRQTASEVDGRHQAQDSRRMDALLYSIVRLLEETTGTRREEFSGAYYMPRSWDPYEVKVLSRDATECECAS